MAMPGFSAANSLQPSVASYTNGAVWNGGDPGAVSPEFLDFIKEAFESVGSALSSAAQAAAGAIASAMSKLSSGGGGGQPFVCSTFVGQALRCGPAGPALAAADITASCLQRVGEVPELAVVCAGLGPSIYALSVEYCKNPSQDVTPFIQQACPGS